MMDELAEQQPSLWQKSTSRLRLSLEASWRFEALFVFGYDQKVRDPDEILSNRIVRERRL